MKTSDVNSIQWCVLPHPDLGRTASWQYCELMMTGSQLSHLATNAFINVLISYIVVQKKDV